jgi:hypothetical protein
MDGLCFGISTILVSIGSISQRQELLNEAATQLIDQPKNPLPSSGFYYF